MTKIIHISEIDTHREGILHILRNGGVVLYPTDTQYGLGVIARNRQAVEKVHAIKKVNGNKPVSIIVPDINQAEKYVYIHDTARELMKKHLPGALTLILPSKDKDLAKSCGNEDEVGVRIPNRKEILELVRELGEPITTTSANISGQEPKTTCEEILKELSGIDLAIDGGDMKDEASTIIRFSGLDCAVLRQGKIII